MLVAGVVCVVAGLVLAALALTGNLDDGGADADDTPRTSTTVGVIAEGIDAGTTAPTTVDGLGVGTVPERDGRSPLRGFGEVQATVTSGSGEVCTVCLLSATTPEQRARGLMQVTDEDLGGYDGMLFEYADPVDGSFWMRNTPMPLSIAYFDAGGELITAVDMEPCTDSPDCPSYPAGAPFAYALEVPQGMLDEVGATGDASLRIDARRCPLATAGG